MFRKLICSMVVMVVAIGFVAAREITGTITKVDGDKVTIQKTKKVDKKQEKDGDPITLTTAKEVAVKFTTKGAEGDAIEGGLKNEMFSGKKGVNATIVTEGDGDKERITKVLVNKKKGK